jgi:hypothetical protein
MHLGDADNKQDCHARESGHPVITTSEVFTLLSGYWIIRLRG